MSMIRPSQRVKSDKKVLQRTLNQTKGGERGKTEKERKDKTISGEGVWKVEWENT